VENEAAEPDLTPMLDVVFIMLIFFIVTATFVKEIGLDLPGKDSAPRDVKAEESIVLEVTATDRYFLERKHVDKRALEHHFARLHAERPEQQLVIKPAGDASVQGLVYAMDVARLAGLPFAIARSAD